MHFDIKEILSAWKAKLNPTEDQRTLAEQRAKICEQCDRVGETLKNNKSTNYCKECGCILPAKVYSYKEGACPLGKWDEIDRKFRNTKALKVLKEGNRKLI